jgi:hypothetical protein
VLLLAVCNEKRDKYLLHGVIMNLGGLLNLLEFPLIRLMLTFGAYIGTNYAHFAAIKAILSSFECFLALQLKINM